MSKLRLIWIIALILLAVPMVNATWYEPLSTGLVAYYKNDNATTSGLTSINSLAGGNGTIHSGVSRNQSGIIYDSYTLLQAHNVNYTGVDINTSQPFSVGLWFNADAISGVSYTFSQSIDGSAATSSFIIDVAAGLRLYGHNATTTSSIISTAFSDTTNWHQVFAVYNSTHLSLYLDGILKGSTPFSTMNDVSSPIRLGWVTGSNGLQGSYDEVGIWNVSLSADYINKSYNGGLGMSYEYTPTSNNAFSYNGSSLPLTGTQHVQNYMNFSQNATITNNTMNCSLILNGAINETKQYSNLTNESYFFNIRFDKVLNYSLHNYFISCKSLITNITTNTSSASFTLSRYTYNVTYVSPQFELSAYKYNLSVLFDSSVSNSSAYLVLNNTFYNPTQINQTFNYTNTNNPISSNTNVTLSWNITLSLANGSSDNFITETYNISLNTITIDNCSASGNKTANFTIFNEDIPSERFNSVLEMVINYWNDDINKKKNTSIYFSGSNNYSICMTPPNQNMKISVYSKNTVVGGFTHRLYVISSNISNTTKEFQLFNYNYTTGISDLKATIRNLNDYSYLSSIYVAFERFYPSENTWRTVQWDKSDDFGSIFFNIREADTDYRLRFYNENYTLLRTTNQMKFLCSGGICDLTFQIDPDISQTVSPNLVVIPSYDNVTGIYTINWTDSLALTSSVRLQISKMNVDSNKTICDVSSTGSSGGLSCNVSSYQGIMRINIYSSASPERAVFSEFIERARQLMAIALNDTKESSLWALGISMTAVFIGFVSPATSLIMLFAGLVFIKIFGIFTPLTVTALIISAILILIIAFKVKQ